MGLFVHHRLLLPACGYCESLHEEEGGGVGSERKSVGESMNLLPCGVVRSQLVNVLCSIFNLRLKFELNL